MIFCLWFQLNFMHTPKKQEKIELQPTYDKLCYYLVGRECKCLLYRLDNDLSKYTQELLQQTMRATVDVVPPHFQRRNAVEYLIRTTKNYLSSILYR